MEYAFNGFTLNLDKFELKRHGKPVAVEPQVFLLLKLLVQNKDRLVTKEEIVQEIWHGGSVSDASISSRIRSARNAIGDDGTKQQLIRTIHGRGFRFLAETTTKTFSRDVGFLGNPQPNATQLPGDTTLEIPLENTKPSIAVLPFEVLGALPANRILADAVPHDLIQALSCLNWILVIARGSTARFRSPVSDIKEIGTALGVRYVLSGSVEILGHALAITTELSDVSTNGIIWTERFTSDTSDVHQIRTEITTKVVSSLEIRIPLNETRKAHLSVSENLDSWANYHLGLRHAGRFTNTDNQKAIAYFERAIRQDPGFARAHAGLSLTSFQTAIMRYDTRDKNAALDARRFAERSVELDPLDPFSNFTLGRSFMLFDDLDSSSEWVARATVLNPNYAQGFYALGFAEMLAGKPTVALVHSDKALALSPLDPLRFGMLAGRTIIHIIDGDYRRAAEAGERASRSPGAHFLVDFGTMIAHSLNHNHSRAKYWANSIRKLRPDADKADFFTLLPFSKVETKLLMSDTLERCGF